MFPLRPEPMQPRFQADRPDGHSLGPVHETPWTAGCRWGRSLQRPRDLTAPLSQPGRGLPAC